MSTKRGVLMGNPTHFSIVGGANPHTRNWLGLKKRVNREKAIKQWHHLAKTLTELGGEVFVLPPDKEHTGLVYPANAGFLTKVDEKVPINRKLFILSNLIPTRQGEREHYKEFLSNLGFIVGEISSRFEGEADFFPVEDKYLFTYGAIKEQRFVLQRTFPFYRRIYGFRSDLGGLEELKYIVDNKEIISLALCNEAHYHGDTVLCAFGPKGEYLLAYLEGLEETSRQILLKQFGNAILPLEESDAKIYAANSFQLSSEQGLFLVMPEGISSTLITMVRDKGVEPILVDVSEFWKKGGGSVKCMICDLGYMIDDQDLPSPEVSSFREKVLYRPETFS